MRLLSKFSNESKISNFGVMQSVLNGAKTVANKVGSVARKGAQVASEAVPAVAKVGGQVAGEAPALSAKQMASLGQLANTFTPESADTFRQLLEEGKNYRQGAWGKAATVANVGMLAGIPLGMAPLFMEDANTKAVKAMRAEDKRRELMGLAPLAATPQMMADDAAKAASKTFSDGGARVVNMAPKYILPGGLPPKSLH